MEAVSCYVKNSYYEEHRVKRCIGNTTKQRIYANLSELKLL